MCASMRVPAMTERLKGAEHLMRLLVEGKDYSTRYLQGPLKM
jgi:hypothetical protein